MDVSEGFPHEDPDSAGPPDSEAEGSGGDSSDPESVEDSEGVGAPIPPVGDVPRKGKGADKKAIFPGSTLTAEDIRQRLEAALRVDGFFESPAEKEADDAEAAGSPDAIIPEEDVAPAPDDDAEDEEERDLDKERKEQDIEDRKQARDLREDVVRLVLAQARIWIEAVLALIFLSMLKLKFTVFGVEIGPIALSDTVLVAMIGGIGIYALFGAVVKGLFPDSNKNQKKEDQR